MSRVLFILLLLPLLSWGQSPVATVLAHPQDYFAPPLDIPLVLSGNFGELRSNHFHAGIDLKTQQREGLAVKASAPGYVKRIKVSPWGYGKALYIQHPNGYTTVYAHLSRFSDEIQQFVRKQQYERQQFDLELFPGDAFYVEQGEIIAWSGNSGGSGGPHLHFEIRDTKTEFPVNPLLFNFDIPDNQAPEIRYLKIYPLSPKAFIRLHYQYPQGKEVLHLTKPAVIAAKKGANGFYLHNINRIEAGGKLGFAISTRDHHDRSWNRLGVYCMELMHNGKEIFSKKMERFGFHESRYLNSLIDYAHYKTEGERFQKSFIDPGNALSVYGPAANRGMVNITLDTTHHFTYHLEDTYGNVSTLDFTVEPDSFQEGWSVQERFSACSEVLPFNRANSFTRNEIRLSFPEGVFYDTVCFQYQRQPMPHKPYSSLHQVHSHLVPLHSYYSISLKAESLPQRLQDKAVIVSQVDGEVDSEGGSYSNGWVTASTRTFGDFYIDVDTIAPEVRALNLYEGANMGYKDDIRLKVEDKLSGIDSYHAFIDNKWVLLEWDPKYNLMYHTFDNLEPGEHTFRVLIRDEVGNETEKTWTFTK